MGSAPGHKADWLWAIRHGPLWPPLGLALIFDASLVWQAISGDLLGIIVGAVFTAAAVLMVLSRRPSPENWDDRITEAAGDFVAALRAALVQHGMPDHEIDQVVADIDWRVARRVLDRRATAGLDADEAERG